MTYGDMVFLEGWSVGIYFRAADSVVRLIRYYYIIGDGRVMMRLGETGMMVRVDGTAEAADGTSSSH